jgi:hypothetical protein
MHNLSAACNKDYFLPSELTYQDVLQHQLKSLFSPIATASCVSPVREHLAGGEPIFQRRPSEYLMYSSRKPTPE